MRLLPVTVRQMVAGLVLSACIGTIGGASAAWAIYHRLGPASGATSPTSQGSARGSGTVQTPTVDAIAAADAASVVKVITQPVTPADLAGDPAGFVSGVVVSADGLIITSTHAIEGATALEIATGGGRAFQAIVAATDIPHGIAMLRAVNASGLHPITFATTPARAGDVAIVLGSPPFASLSVTLGTVNSTGRTVTTVADAGGGGVGATLLDVMTADALPDASADGGPVLDANGNLIGIVAGGQHVGVPGMVALSGRYAAALVDRATNGSLAVQPTFGVLSVWLDPATAAATHLVPGALIRSVDPSGPSAGLLQPGDVVSAVDGIAIDDTHPFDPATFGKDVGQPVTLTVTRAGRSISVNVTVAAG